MKLDVIFINSKNNIEAGFIMIDLLNYINNNKNGKFEQVSLDLKSQYQGKLSYTLKYQLTES